MDTDLPNLPAFVSLPNLLLTILFIVPGFLAEEELRKKFPFRRSTTFERTVYSIYYSVWIHTFFLLVILASCFPSELFLTRQPYIEIMRIAGLLPLVVFIYCAFAMLAGQLYGRIFLVKYYEWNKKEISSFLPLWSRSFPDDKVTFAVIKLKNGVLYSGQIKYIPSDYDLLSSSEKDVYVVSPRICIFQNGAWKNLEKEGVEGILLNTRDVMSLELAFRDIKHASR
ncbi:MAG TPA: DUF6338 family protein [Candidatus Hypogeohydataceae bacterium YC41]